MRMLGYFRKRGAKSKDSKSPQGALEKTLFSLGVTQIHVRYDCKLKVSRLLCSSVTEQITLATLAVTLTLGT